MTSPSEASGAGVSVGVSVEDEGSDCDGVESVGVGSVGISDGFGAALGTTTHEHELKVVRKSNT